LASEKLSTKSYHLNIKLAIFIAGHFYTLGRATCITGHTCKYTAAKVSNSLPDLRFPQKLIYKRFGELILELQNKHLEAWFPLWLPWKLHTKFTTAQNNELQLLSVILKSAE